jgi:serine/threonine-protein kinase
MAVLLFTDLVGSLRLKSELGVEAYAAVLRRHDQIVRTAISGFADARILKDTGDGVFASFVRVSDAVNSALLIQSMLANEPWPNGPPRVRIGIGLGEVALVGEEPDGSAKVVGLAADLTARLMGLASGGQILLSRAVFDQARQFVRGHPRLPGNAAIPDVRWAAHGSYLMHGHDDPIDVFEVGAEGIAPLTPPPDADKARRAVAADEEPTLGWRPAAGIPIPGRPGWTLVKRVGIGGFGEVWLGEHRKLHTSRVFKFCFDAEKLRSLKREMTLFKLIRSALGERPDIARLYEVKLDKPPFFLESEYTSYGNLEEWAAANDGVQFLTIPTRIELVAEIAVAVAAAHSVGVLHKDIKPSNILIYEDSDGRPHPRLSDFGISSVQDRSQFREFDITAMGFTGTEDTSGQTGTRMYSPPESQAGRPFTTEGDVYAIGVLLYQMVMGNLHVPLAQGWERDIDDEILRQDIAHCVEGDPNRRLGSAAELAKRLRSLEQRRHTRDREAQLRFQEQQRSAEKVKAVMQREQLWRILAGLGFALAGLFGLILLVKSLR